MLIDEFLPVFDFSEYHQTTVAAPPEWIYESLWAMDMGKSPLVGSLFFLRELPWRLRTGDFRSKGLGGSMEDLLQFGFIPLGQDRPREFVFGLLGCFWKLNLSITPLTPREFRGFSNEGFAKVAANFRIDPLGPKSCRLSTETRIQCLGDRAKRRFRLYWLMIRPFSGLIRREWLRLIRREAETKRAGEAGI